MTESRRYVLSFQARKEQDRRTDGRTDGRKNILQAATAKRARHSAVKKISSR